MAFDAHKNLAHGTVAAAPSPALSGTSLTLSSGQGARLPATPFNASVGPASFTVGEAPDPTNTEIVRVTAVVGDALTITRAQEGTSARTILIGDQFENTVTAKAFTDIEKLVSVYPSGGDDSTQLQAAINELAGRGTLTLGPGTFKLESAVLKLPRSAAGLRIRGSGVGATTIKLATGARRAFDFAKIADGDLFQNLELSDFTVDAAEIEDYDHVVIGTYIGGTKESEINQTTNVSFDRLAFRRIRTINVPDLAASLGTKENGCHRLNIYIAPLVTTGSGYTATNILCEDLDFEGGNYGIAVGCAGDAEGHNPGASAYSYDNVTFLRCRHKRKHLPTAHFTTAGFHIGAYAIGGNAVIRDCFTQNEADVGYEIDNAGRFRMEGCQTKDCGFGVLPYVYNEPVNAKDGHYTIEGLKTELTTAFTNEPKPIGTNEIFGTGFLMPGSSLPLRSLAITDWTHIDMSANACHPAMSIQKGNIAQLTMTRCRYQATSVNVPTKEKLTRWAWLIAPATGLANAMGVTMRDCYVKMEGLVAAEGFTHLYPVYFGAESKTEGEYRFVHIDGLTFEIALNSFGTNPEELKGIYFEKCLVNSATLRGVHYRTFGTLAKAWGIVVGGEAAVANQVRVEQCDFTGLGAEAVEVAIGGAESAKRAFARNNTGFKSLLTPAKPLTVTGLASGAGKALNTLSYGLNPGETANLPSYPVELWFEKGSGTKVTKIEISVNGGTTWAVVYEQAEGAMATNVTFGPYIPETQVRVTFTAGTQPTITMIPVAP